MKKVFRLFALVLCVASLLCAAMAGAADVPYGTDGETVWREGPNGKETLEGVTPFDVADSMYTGFQVGSEVWCIDTVFGAMDPIRITVKEGETCRGAALHVTPSVMLLCLVSDKGENIVIFDRESGKRLAQTPGVIGNGSNGNNLHWIDDYRCLFTTSVLGTQRGKKSGPWHGAAVMEMFTNGGKNFELVVYTLAEPTETEHYQAYEIDGDQCSIIRYTVNSASDWEKLDEGKALDSVGSMDFVSVPVPAAG